MGNISIQQAIKLGMQQLQQARLDNDTLKLDCEILLLAAINQGLEQSKNKTWLLTWPENMLTEAQLQHYQNSLAQRATGKPIAYITGKKDFWSFSLKVSPDTLIPRPETELLVECALEKLPFHMPLKVLDLGTGSGAIALAIASERPEISLIASDASTAALDMAQTNARNLQLPNIQFYHSDWYQNIPAYKFDLIVSNPPYIAPNDTQLEQNVKQFEPQKALLSDNNGLNDIRQIITDSPGYIQSGGWLILEHGYTQGAAVREIFRHSGATSIETIKDLNDLDRLTMGRFV